MFTRHDKINSKTVKPLESLTKIMAAKTLLADDKRHNLAEQIRKLSLLDKSNFDNFKQTISDNLIDYCQSLPDTFNNYYSNPVGLLDHALNRTEIALNLFQNYLVPNDQGAYSEEQKLWQYALYSAGMLQGIGKLFSDYKINCFDQNGQLIKQWNPLLEKLSETGAYYDYIFEKESNADFRKRLNILLARAIMPVQGFAWIVGNSQVLQVWLALLNEDMHSSGTLGAILNRANALAIQRYLNELYQSLKKTRPIAKKTSTFSDQPDPANLDKLAGLEFMRWLQEALANGTVQINKAPLLAVPGGVLMCADIFKYFVQHHPEFKWQAAQKGMLSLGLDIDQENPNNRFTDPESKKMVTGMVIKDFSVILPDNFHILSNASNQSNVSALNFIYHHGTNSAEFNKDLPSLTAANLWEEIAVSHHAPTQGYFGG